MSDSQRADATVDDGPPALDLSGIFQLAPVPLWLEDYGAIRRLFTRWRAEGVEDLRAFFAEDPERVARCSAAIRILAVNDCALELYGARDLAHLRENLPVIFAGEMLQTLAGELVQLWENGESFQNSAVNFTIGGRRLDIHLRGRVLPGHEADWTRVLVSTTDVTEREAAGRRLVASESYATGLFEHSPVSLWVEDFGAIHRLLVDLRRRGITDLRTFLDVHPEFVARCMSEIRVVDVNRHTLELFGAGSRDELLMRLDDVFGASMEAHFREQVIDLWEGRLFQVREVVNSTLGGDDLHLHMQFSVLPGHEADWSLVQVALTDITARKKAEAYLEYLGQHDVLTRLYNRSFYVEELNRLERKGPWPVAVLVADLDGLKEVNDNLGHAAGDELLRRAGEVLAEAVRRPAHAARIGGDEFVVLMPASTAEDAANLVAEIAKLVEVNNTFYPGAPLSLSFGVAGAERGERLEEAVKHADLRMYAAKQEFYRTTGDRRGRRAPDPA